MNIIELITKNPAFPIATFIIGILVRTYFYYKSKKTKVLKYVLKSYNLVKDHTSKFTDLNIKYKNEDVKNFTVTKMIFWNAGKETLDGKDITTAEPLTLKIKDGFRFLEVSILKANNEASQISISPIQNNNTINIAYDYLDNLDGAVINIIHDATKSDDIEFSGKIKGLKKIVKTSFPKAPDSVLIFVPFPIHKDISKYSPNKRRFLYGLSHLGFALTMAAFFVSAYFLEHQFPDNQFFNSDGDKEMSIWILIVPCGLLALNGFYVMSKKLPKDLDVYEDI